jgi:large subunit ribosomal protein L25
MESIEIKATTREERGKGAARRLRRAGLIPAIYYGPKTGTLALSIDSFEFRKTIKGKAGENAIVNLNLAEKEEKTKKFAMIREVQVDALANQILHVDFYEIDLKEKVEVSVPIELTGKAEGVKLGGVLQQIERELQIRCMPLQIPDKIEVDVSRLGIGESLHVRDIEVAEGIEVLTSGDHTLLTVASPMVEPEKVVEEALEVEAPTTKKEEKSSE